MVEIKIYKYVPHNSYNRDPVVWKTFTGDSWSMINNTDNCVIKIVDGNKSTSFIFNPKNHFVEVENDNESNC
jgi:hypothetical protein